MKVTVKNSPIENIEVDAIILSSFEDSKNPTYKKHISSELIKLIDKTIKDEDFKGKTGSTLLIRTNGLIKAKKIILLGLGEKNKFNLDTLRKVQSASTRKAKQEKAKKICTLLHGGEVAKLDTKEVAQIIVEISNLSIYEFDKYKSKDKDDEKNTIEELIIFEPNKQKNKSILDGIKKGILFAQAQKLGRDLVSEPPSIATPTFLSKVAEEIAKKNNLKIKILNESECKKLGMNAFLAVGNGSDEPSKFIEIKYSPKVKTKKHIVIIGKGVTFDSGGLSLKPSKSMETMKMDMSGSAAVISTMSAIKELNPKVHVTMIVAACENMPDGKSYKLGDVVKAMNGKTIEILNTDAEGRVTLADSLSYATTLKPDAIIDLATLTGACVVALGDYTTGVMTNNQKLADLVIKSGNEVGERMWQLPLFDEDRDKIKSDVADMINTGSRGGAGAQNGAVLLEKFVDNIPWVHLDIAGPAWIDSANAYGPKGPTGVGVRTLLNFLDKYANKI